MINMSLWLPVVAYHGVVLWEGDQEFQSSPWKGCWWIWQGIYMNLVIESQNESNMSTRPTSKSKTIYNPSIIQRIADIGIVGSTTGQDEVMIASLQEKGSLWKKERTRSSYIALETLVQVWDRGSRVTDDVVERFSSAYMVDSQQWPSPMNIERQSCVHTATRHVYIRCKANMFKEKWWKRDRWAL